MHDNKGRKRASFLVCLGAILCAASTSHGDARFGAAFDIVGEYSEMNGTLLIGVAETDESFDYNPAPMAWRLWGSIEAFSGRLIIASSLRMPYTAQGGQGDPSFEFGYLIEPTVGYEWTYDIKKTLDVPIVARVGMPILIPSGDFNQQIMVLDPVGAVPGPRFGWLVGASAGLRKKLGSRYYLRGDVHFEYSQVFLFATRAEVGGVAYNKDWRNDAFRFSLGVGMEVEI